jgi:hypothetical protein
MIALMTSLSDLITLNYVETITSLNVIPDRSIEEFSISIRPQY